MALSIEIVQIIHPEQSIVDQPEIASPVWEN